MPTIRERIGKFLGYADTQQAAVSQLLSELLYANPRVQTASGFRYNPNILVQRKSLRVYDEMRRDEQIKAAMSLKKQFVMASGWEVVSPEDKDDTWEVTEFVKDNFEDMGEEFSVAVLQMLTCLDYGFSVTEKVYAYRDEDGLLGIECLRTVAPHDIQFYTDPYGNLLEDGVRQTGNNKQSNALPVDKFVILPWQPEFGNWYGDSDLNAVHRPWLIKDQAYQWLAMLLERGGIPPMIVDYNPSKIPDEIRSKLKAALQNLQAGSTLLFPRGETADSINFQWPEMAGQVSTVFIPAFDMFNKDISKGLLMPGLLGLTPDSKFGSRANGDTHFDVFLLVIEHLRNIVASAIQTQIVKELVDLNFIVGPDEYPAFRWKPLSDDVKAELITLWGTLTGQKVVLSTPADEETIRERLKMPPREEAWKSVEDSPKPTDPNAPVIDPNAQIDPETGKPIPPDPNAPPQQNDKPPAGQGNNLPPKQNRRSRKARAYALPADANRTPTSYEMKVDFVRIQKDLDGGVNDYLPRLRSTLAESRDQTIQQVRSEFKGDLAYATSFATLPGTDDFHSTMKAMFKDIHAAGRNSIRTEVPQAYKSLPTANLDDALNYLNAKAVQVSGVTEQRIVDQVKQALTQAVSTGEPLDDTVARLRTIFGPYTDQSLDENGDLSDPHRLETIVRTNLTDVYNMGRMLQANQAGDFLEGWQYSAIIDDRTTDVCRMLDGTVFEAGDPRADQCRPPRHFNCLPGDSLVSASSAITGYSKRWHEGEVVILKTASALELSATPNHPILTRRGWVPAGSVRVGDDVVRDLSEHGRVTIDADHQAMPTRIEDVVRSLGQARGMKPVSVPLAAEDFHGDAREGEVASIWSDSLLSNGIVASALEQLRQFILVFGRLPKPAIAGVDLPSLGALGKLIVSPRFAAHRGVSAFDTRSAGAKRNAYRSQQTADGGARDAELARAILSGETGAIEFERVISADVRDFSGHVYNLETGGGFYTADGLIVHNCRSVMVPITTGETINQDDLITPEDFNKAMDLSGDGF